MKKSGLLLVICIVWGSLTAQISGPEAQFAGQNINNSIKYIFPDPVTCIIQEYILRDTTQVYFISLEEKGSFIDLIILNLSLSNFLLEKDVYAHVSSTNRYCVVNNKALPIEFVNEKYYSDNYWYICGKAILIRLKRVSPGNLIFSGSTTITIE